ncbi:hypothetical protein RvY_16040 [Ramazzottius varieornatus]|uniref:Adipokinetic hormone 1 n=1 Tax=Ramazzottius varieornatus TaxID=947166 RepID=A0A1D1VYG5_RAMVA|nr:hypothetical protein RvY_16040 [Ramazzottius varieornatus]
MANSTVFSALRGILLATLLALVVLQVLLPTAEAQLSFSTGWGHGKRSSMPALSASDLSKLPLACTSSYANDVFHLRLQQLIQEEVARQVACNRS